MKTLLVYYSYTGNTKIIADKIKDKLNCDVVKLKPVVPFSTNYQKVVEEYQSNDIDHKLIDIEDININMNDYDKVILGTPVWWYTITPVLRTFLTKYDLNNKKIYVFVTNAGWLGRTFEEIEDMCNSNIEENLNIKFSEDYHEHRCLTPDSEIEAWIEKIR